MSVTKLPGTCLRLTVAWFIAVLLAAPSSAGEIVRVTIKDLAFSPARTTVKVGDTIEWANGDFVDHTATDKGGAWDLAIAAGKTARLPITTAGTFAYYCKFHPGMTGRIDVDAK
ncbi:Amicyanin-alpha [Hyphomicrobium sp. 1Nfss2.1]